MWAKEENVMFSVSNNIILIKSEVHYEQEISPDYRPFPPGLTVTLSQPLNLRHFTLCSLA